MLKGSEEKKRREKIREDKGGCKEDQRRGMNE